VAVGEDRAYAIPHILNDHPDTDVLLMDDAFQHRRIKPNLEILVTDYTRLFYKDFILPAGLLRESRHGARRADVVVVTKCPEEISLDERGEITGNIRKYSGPEKPVFFSFIDYDDPKADGFKNRTIGEKIILVTGIANPEPLVKHLQSGYHVIKHFSFPDHHFFSKKDIDSMIRYYDLHGDKNVSFLFTEKDFMRLKGSGNEDKLTGYPVFFQPITYKFVAHGEEFDSMIIDSTGEFIN
ncbi:MAG: tetraacyldisaccharide 4'-kinase, partial [Cyclobacteriaceae bacterium]|nr:tetraacyldisaccharide 4'-kinase [Cyclobacteriaceae bacterium]